MAPKYPKWYLEHLSWLAARERALIEASTTTYQVADSPANAPGWRDLGMEFSCVPDALYPWDPTILKQIWAFDPGVIPVWVRWAFLAPNSTSTVVFGRHALGRRLVDPRRDLTMFSVTMPSMPCQGVTFAQPNELFLYWAGPTDGECPGEYRAFDIELVKYLLERQIHDLSPAEIKDKYILGPLLRDVERANKAREEEKYARRDLDRYMDKQLENVSEVELRDWVYRKMAKKEVKPMVYVRREPTS